MLMKKKVTSIFVSLLFLVLTIFGLSGCNLKKNNSSSSEESSTPEATVKIALSQSEMTMAHLTTTSISATVEGTDKEVSWTTENEAIIMLSANGNTATVTAIAEGETSVTATVEDKSATCVITVTRTEEVPVLIGLKQSISLLSQETLTLAPEMLFGGNTVSNVVYTYTSDAPTVVSVNENGVLKGETVGTANITVKANYYGYETEKIVAVTVIENATLSIVSEANEVYLANPNNNPEYKTTLPLTVKVFENGTEVTNAGVNFSVDTQCATVSTDGVVSPVSVGEVTVTASWTSSAGTLITDEIILMVKKAEVKAIGTADIDRGGAVTLDLSKYEGISAGNFLVTDPKIGESFTATCNGSLLMLTASKLGVGECELILENDMVRYTVDVTILSKLITTKEELLNLISYASNVQDVSWEIWGLAMSAKRYDGYFKLGANIDLGSSVVTASGGTQYDNAAAMEAGLHGVFDGQGYTISNGIYGAGGLLGMVSTEGVVKNVAFVQSVIGKSARGDTSTGQHCAIIAAGFHGTAQNVFIDAIHEETTWFGGPFGYCSYGATYENVIVYFPSTTGDGNAIARVIRGENKATGLYVFANNTASNNNAEVTNISGIEDAFGDGCKINPYNTAISSLTIEGFDEEIWNLKGEKAIFLSQISEIVDKCEEIDGSTVFVGKSISFGNAVMGQPIVVSAKNTLPNGVTLTNNVLNVSDALTADATVTLIVDWNNGIYTKEITVTVKTALLYQVASVYSYEKYTGLNGNEKVANTANFTVDLTNAQTTNGQAVQIPTDKTYEATFTNGTTTIPVANYTLNGNVITFTAETILQVAGGEYNFELIADGGTYRLSIPVEIINKNISTAEQLLNLVKYADNVRELSWTLYGQTQTGKAYDGYFKLTANINLGTTNVTNDDVWATMYYGGTNNAAGGSDDALGLKAGLNGVFNGNGFTITGGVYGVGGLLGMVSESGVVKNVAFVNAKMSTGGFVGIVAGAFNGKAQNVLVDVTNFDGDAPTSGPFGYSVMNATFENVVVYIPDDGVTGNSTYMGAIGYVNRNTMCTNVYVFTNTEYIFASGSWYEAANAAAHGVSAYGLTANLSSTTIGTAGFDATIWNLTGSKAVFVEKNA